MGVVNTASAVITNITAAPPKVNDPRTSGRNFTKNALVTTVTGDSIASHYGFFRLPVNARLIAFKYDCDALSTAVAGDFGLWEVSNPFLPVTQAGSISNAKQFFGAAASLVAAQVDTSLKMNNSNFWKPSNADQFIWKQLGLTTDPSQAANGPVEYDVVLTLTVAVVAGGVVNVECTYKMP